MTPATADRLRRHVLVIDDEALYTAHHHDLELVGGILVAELGRGIVTFYDSTYDQATARRTVTLTSYPEADAPTLYAALARYELAEAVELLPPPRYTPTDPPRRPRP